MDAFRLIKSKKKEKKKKVFVRTRKHSIILLKEKSQYGVFFLDKLENTPKAYTEFPPRTN